MNKRRGFFRLVIVLSIIIWLIVSLFVPYDKVRFSSSIGLFVFIFTGILAVLLVWLIYFLVLFIIKGFTNQSKREKRINPKRGFFRLVIVLSVVIWLVWFLIGFYDYFFKIETLTFEEQMHLELLRKMGGGQENFSIEDFLYWVGGGFIVGCISAIGVWASYGLVLFVIKGFTSQSIQKKEK